MEIAYIREFVVLAGTGNFIEAADRLFISQSSLSKHIKSIETELGVSLFNRTTRKVELSEFGQIFLPYADQIVRVQNEYTAAFLNSFENTQKTIKLGSIPSMVQYNITDILATFKKSNPNCTIDVLQAGSDQLENMLRENKCDIAFIRQVVDINNEFIKIPYMVDTLVAVFPCNHPLAKCESLSLEQLKDEEFLLLSNRSNTYNLYKNECRKSGFEPKVILANGQLDNIIDLVAKGMGITLIMKRLAVRLTNPNISIVDIIPVISTQISLCYMKNRELSLTAKHFLNSAGINSANE